jgi:hypothetical protein
MKAHRKVGLFYCVPSKGVDKEVQVLWGAGRSDPHEPQGDKPGDRSGREAGAERSE